jgi:hypothetical protein
MDHLIDGDDGGVVQRGGSAGFFDEAFDESGTAEGRATL